MTAGELLGRRLVWHWQLRGICRIGQMDESEAPFVSRQQRIAFNEAWRRHVNEAWRRAHEGAHDRPDAGRLTGFRCECGQMNCGSHVRLSVREWDEARSESDRFVVAPGHVARDVEVVVERYPNFWLVEKQGEAEEIVEELQ